MKIFLASLLLVLGLGFMAGCGPKDERSARRIETRSESIRRDLKNLPHDWELFWMTDEPSHLTRWDGP